MSTKSKGVKNGKSRQVLLVVIATAGLLTGLWYVLINSQQQGLKALADKINAAERKLQTVRKVCDGAQSVEEQLTLASGRLSKQEDEMATGDYYSWVINRIRQFKLSYRVEIPQFSTIVGPAETTLLPRFPYKQVTLSIAGTGYFHDIGQFVADYENEFPYSRVQNLELEPAPALVGAEKEKLAFRMDVVTLVKPGA